MKYINALSLSPDVNDWLTNSHQPRILHVFDPACNLINERREILSIVTQQIGNGPFNLVVEGNILFSRHLNLQSPVSVLPTQLIIRDLTINTATAKLWTPRPDWEILHAKRDNILNQLTSSPLTNYQKHGLQSPVSNSLFSNLCSSLATADPSSSRAAAKQLAGLGIGLTPAGDDFIVGATLATWIIHPIEIASILAKEITNAAAPLTTSLSAAWLKSAEKGEAGILWHNFFNALMIDDKPAIQLQITKLLSVGETSGADALAGFFGVFMSWMEHKEKELSVYENSSDRRYV